MANLTEKDIKKGVLKGTGNSDIIKIDANPVGLTNKKITVKAGNGSDDISVSNHYGKMYVYAGMGSDTIDTSYANNYLYGESGTNTFKIANHQHKTTIYAGKGKAIIDVSSITTINDNFFANENMNDYFVRKGNDLIMYPQKGYKDSRIVTIKDFYKQKGEFILQYEVWENEAWVPKQYDLRDLKLTTSIEDFKSANFSGGRLNECIYGDARKNTIKGGDGSDEIYGGAGNDKLYGNNGALDVILGEDGNDIIYGKDKNSSDYIMTALDGGHGNDTIYGGHGQDIIDGGAGNDKLYGKTGKNTYIYSGGNDTIYLEQNSETILRINDYEFQNKLKKGNDLLINLKQGEEAGSILLKNFFKLNNIGETISIYKGDLEIESNLIDFLPYYDAHFQASGSGTIKGTKYNDDIFGSIKADKIYSYAGYDTIDPNLGNDKIYAGESYSTIMFQTGDGKDTIYGGYNNLKFLDVRLEELKYQRVKDNLIIKYSDKDSVTLADYFKYKTSVEYISDEYNNSQDFYETLFYYSNKLEYSYGMGTVKFYSMPDSSNIVDFVGDKINLDNAKCKKSGNDLIFYGFGGKKDKIVVVDYYKNGLDGYIRQNGVNQYTLNDIMAYNHGTITKTKFTSSFWNDSLSGSYYNDIIKTKDGHDTINGSYGNDTVYAGNGNDLINYEAYSSPSINKLYGEAGNDTIKTGSNNDIIYGGSGNDYIVSNYGEDKLYGGSGNDNIEAGGDNDYVDGGTGNDNIRGGYGNDTLKGGSGNDVIFSDNGTNNIYAGKGNDHIYVNPSDNSSANNYVRGDSGNDTINVEAGNNNLIYGDSGNDDISVYGTAVNNKIYAGTGNDIIRDNGSSTQIYAGSGNDQISISSSANYSEVEAGSGNDEIIVHGNEVKIEGGSGNDTYHLYSYYTDIEDSSGNDKYYVDSLEDLGHTYTIDDSKGKDTLYINRTKNDLSLMRFNLELNSKGKINDMDDITLRIGSERENGEIKIEEYFGSGCIERIESSDGYYLTKAQLQNVAQEIAAWLVENNFSSEQVAANASSENYDMLRAFYNDVNWQK